MYRPDGEVAHRPGRRDRPRDRPRPADLRGAAARTSRSGSSSASAPTSTSATSHPRDVISLETLRVGLRADTLLLFHGERRRRRDPPRPPRRDRRQRRRPQRVHGLDATRRSTTRGREQARGAGRRRARARAGASSGPASSRGARETAGDRRRGGRPRAARRRAASPSRTAARWEGRLLADIEREEPEAWAAWRRGGRGLPLPRRRVAGRAPGARARRRSTTSPPGRCPRSSSPTAARSARSPPPRDPRGLDAFHDLDVPNATVIRLDDPRPMRRRAA